MRCFTPFVVFAGVVLAATTVSAGDKPLASTPEKKNDEEMVILSPFCVDASGFGGYLGATPGGFQDINFGRSLLEWGMLPRPGEVTAEGLFSQFDLPTPDAEKSRRLLSITGDAKAASILSKPAVTHLAQLGFSSGLDVRTWQRDPVFLVVVADVSGSMSGNLPLLKDSIRTMLTKLGPDDAFALISFATDVQLDRAPERVSPATVAAVDALAIRGGTNIEAGLELGFTVAQTKVAGFAGRTRVVLITDAMPNIGATAAGSFMKQAEAASIAGTGLTTIGVGLQFSAEFVKQVSSVGGGNAFYFADAGQMQKKLTEDFDFMVTELAFDIEIRVDPTPGFRLVDVYGLPGDICSRTPEGGLLMDLATLFLSRERGAIFLSFAADHPVATGAVLGRASLSYSLYGAAAPERSEFPLTVCSEQRAGLGICRGEMLINEYEALQAAGTAFYETGDIAKATSLTTALAELFTDDGDHALKDERELLENLANFLELAGQDPDLKSGVFRVPAEKSPLVGVWQFSPTADAKISAPARYLVFLPSGQAGFLDGRGDDNLRSVKWKGRNLGNGRGNGVTLGVDHGELVYRSADRETRQQTSWRLVRCEATQPWREEGATVVPNPNEVYYAADTFVGRRVRTELRDVASAITIVTSQLFAAGELQAESQVDEDDEVVELICAWVVEESMEASASLTKD